MGYIFRTIKKLFFWGYARNTWQYDVLCVLILAFIFLTPQGWFDVGSSLKSNMFRGEPAGTTGHQSPFATKVILTIADNSQAQMGRDALENHLRTITGRSDLEVLNVEPKRDSGGKIVALEVDIR
ncbi:MAG TPA: hypothetical protein VJ715_20025 [Pyrinomonadaceae bacterium]|nr:hypothetical protein [Pyrinomonadaceae bacterium]